ncbi:MAG: RNA-binding protein RNP-1 [Parcubacteria group bacterium GW2011_GWB1_56_8]|nr:MAG: RNA-binding protein RNP-1 [Parcubacteria group bacterium GW2011_GWB1_56_8]
MPRFYVGNISYDATEFDLRDFFSDYEVVDVKVLYDKETKRSRGFGFVEVSDATAEEIIADLDGREFMGREARVNEAEPQVFRTPHRVSPRRGTRGVGGL